MSPNSLQQRQSTGANRTGVSRGNENGGSSLVGPEKPQTSRTCSCRSVFFLLFLLVISVALGGFEEQKMLLLASPKTVVGNNSAVKKDNTKHTADPSTTKAKPPEINKTKKDKEKVPSTPDNPKAEKDTQSDKAKDKKDVAPSKPDTTKKPDKKDNKKRNFVDFAVVGFEKCGTTFLLDRVFTPSEQVYMTGGEEYERPHELREVDQDHIDQLYQRVQPHLHQKTPDGTPIKVGFKNPKVLLDKVALSNMQKNFPKMKMIVTMRHPVLWFQTWYNYKLRGGKFKHIPNIKPRKMVGLCGDACLEKGPEGHCIPVDQSEGCSAHGYFHQWLSRFGFTPRDTEEELRLLDNTQMKALPFPNTKVFVTEMGQMDGKNVTFADGLMRSMERFLGLQPNALPPRKKYRHPKDIWTNETWAQRLEICDPQHEEIRLKLLQQSKKASRWIERYFIKSPQVVIYERHDFLSRIRQWREDPCLSPDSGYAKPFEAISIVDPKQ